MTSLAARFGTGYLVARLARVIGWSPVGRRLVLRDAEGPHGQAFEGRTGSVTSIEGGVMQVDLDPESETSGPAATRLRLTPRHEGWSAHSLMLCPVAVVAEVVSDAGTDRPVTIAVASMLEASAAGPAKSR